MNMNNLPISTAVIEPRISSVPAQVVCLTVLP